MNRHPCGVSWQGGIGSLGWYLEALKPMEGFTPFHLSWESEQPHDDPRWRTPGRLSIHLFRARVSVLWSFGRHDGCM